MIVAKRFQVMGIYAKTPKALQIIKWYLVRIGIYLLVWINTREIALMCQSLLQPIMAYS
jgi:hypothetical protein